VATDGNDNNDGSFDYPWATFTYSESQLSPGDTLLIKDGTYNDTLRGTSGTEGNPVTVAALNDGQVTVDCNGSAYPSYISGKQDIVVEGIIFKNSSTSAVNVYYSDRITLKRCSAYNADAGNNMCFNIAYSDNCLVEDCIATGTCRKLFQAYECTYITFRRCWGWWYDHDTTPYAFGSIYNSQHCLVENCVGTRNPATYDKDVRGFGLTSNPTVPNYNAFCGNVMYNFYRRPFKTWSEKTQCTGNEFYHNVALNMRAEDPAYSFFWQACDSSMLYDHFTTRGFHNSRGYWLEAGNRKMENNHGTVKNSIFITGSIGIDFNSAEGATLANSYCCFYDVTTPYAGEASAGTGDVTVDPGFDTATYGMGGYLFVPDGSPVKTAGEGGTQMGAEVLYRYVDGVLTGDPLWPWPMESRIQAETYDIVGTKLSCTWESDNGATGGVWKTLDGIYGPQAPTADFEGSPLSGDAPLTVNFTDLSTQSPTSWSWTFGDGGTSGAQHPSHEYTVANTYTVSLEACNAQGCDTETKTDYITVTSPQPPVADFSGNPLSGYAPLTVYFTDQSTNTPTSWSWTFGDSGTSSAENPSHEYTAVNTYDVSLTATNAQGQDTETKLDYITVSEAPDLSCHVGDISMAQAGPPSYKATATITVHDQDCLPLAGVTVDITWTGAAPGTDSDITDENGQVTFTSDRNKAGGTFTCCVDNLTKSGYPYQSGDNHETSDQITLP